MLVPLDELLSRRYAPTPLAPCARRAQMACLGLWAERWPSTTRPLRLPLPATTLQHSRVLLLVAFDCCSRPVCVCVRARACWRCLQSSSSSEASYPNLIQHQTRAATRCSSSTLVRVRSRARLCLASAWLQPRFAAAQRVSTSRPHTRAPRHAHSRYVELSSISYCILQTNAVRPSTQKAALIWRGCAGHCIVCAK